MIAPGRTLMLLLLGFFLAGNIPEMVAQQPGTADPAFGLNGVVLTDFNGKHNHAVAIAVQPDDRILVGGNTNEMFEPYACHLVRYQSNGAYDNSFGTGGKVTFVLGGEDNVMSDLMVTAAGGILVVGTATDGPVKMIAIAAFTASGEPDITFGTNGIIKTNLGQDTWGLCLAEQEDGRIVVGGMIDYGSGTDRDAVVCRYLPSGTADLSFGTSGHVVIDLDDGSCDMPGDILVHDNRILLSSMAYNGGGEDYDAVAVVALLPDGTKDPLFGIGGITLFDGVTIDAGFLEPGTSMVTDDQNRIVVAGWIQSLDGSDFALYRFLSNGYPDATFDGDGMVVTDMIGINAALSLVIQPDQKLVAGGYHHNTTDYDFCLARYLPDGSLDAGFGTHFGVSFLQVGLGSNSYDIIRGMALQPSNGMLLATGEANNAAENTDFATIRCYTGLSVGAEEMGPDPVSVKLYPNPVKGRTLAIRISGIREEGVVSRLFQSDGKMVCTWNLRLNADRIQELSIPLPDEMGAGSYRMVISAGSEIIHSGDVIVP